MLKCFSTLPPFSLTAKVTNTGSAAGERGLEMQLESILARYLEALHSLNILPIPLTPVSGNHSEAVLQPKSYYVISYIPIFYFVH